MGDGTLAVLAERDFTFGPKPTVVPIAPQYGRLLRFLRDSAAPVTVGGLSVIKAEEWTLPLRSPGGEVALLIDKAGVMPISFHLSGRFEMPTEAVADGVWTQQGVSEGSYLVVPHYDGGILGTPIEVEVRNGDSTVLPVKPQSVGAIHLQASPTTCGRASGLLLFVVEGMANGGERRRKLLELSSNQDCQWSIGGLKPGTYEAVLEGLHLSSTIRRTVEEQRVTSGWFPDNATTIAGHVSGSVQDLEQLTLEFAPSQGGPRASTKLDAIGGYSLGLPNAGDYTMAILGATLVPRIRKVHLIEGDNLIDWVIRGSMLTVRVRGWNGATPTHITIRSERSEVNATINAGDAAEIKKAMLPQGLYSVTATQDDGTVSSESKFVALNGDDDEAVVDLELVENTSLLQVVNEFGQPVDARIGAMFPEPQPVSPGVFSLRTVAPGTEIRVIPSGRYTPSCRVNVLGRDLEATLTLGRVVQIELPAPNMTFIAITDGSIEGIEGTDCAVPLVDFKWTNVARSSGGTRFTLTNFPSRGQLVFRGPSGRKPIHISDAATIIILR